MNWLKLKLALIWQNRTKCAGIAMGVGAAIQSTLAQYGHIIPEKWHGVLLGIAGIITFLIGLFNTFQGL